MACSSPSPDTASAFDMSPTENRKGVYTTAGILAALAVAIYVAFIASGVVGR